VRGACGVHAGCARRRRPRRMRCVSARQQRASRCNSRRMRCVSARQQRASRRRPRRTPRVSAGGTRGEALVLSDIRTASIGCASSPAQCPRRLTLIPIALRIPRATERAGRRVREHEGFAPRATRPFGPASWEGRKAQCVSTRQQRASRREPRRMPRVSAGGTRGEALVLSDIRTASIGCASSPAQCPR